MMKSHSSGLNKINNTIKYINYRLTNKKKSTKFLKEWLGSFPGLSSKISQIIGDKLEDKSPLIDSVADFTIPYEEVFQIIRTTMPQIADEIKLLDKRAHTASVGQVHRLVLKNDKEYAVKIQYPGISDIIDQQINKLFKIYSLLPFSHKNNFAPEDYQSLFEKILKNETNYLEEARKQKLFYEHFHKHKIKTIVPRIHLENCSQSVLLQDWVEGVTVDSFLKKGKPEKIKAAANLVNIFFEMLFGLRFFQTDFNFGNIGFKMNAEGGFESVVLYDFGATLPLDDNHAAIMWDLLKCVVEEQTISPFDYFVSLGFDGKKLKYIAHLLPAVMNLMLEPFSENRPYKISEWNLKLRLNTILGDDKWWFRAAGPSWFFMFLKAANGLFTLLEKLDVNINFNQLYQNFKNGGSYADKLQPQINTDQHLKFSIENFTTKACAKHLNITLFEGLTEKVNLQMPCRVIDMIEEVIPAEYLGAIKSRGISLKNIKEQVGRSGYGKQILVEEQFEERKLKIWLS